ncbi:MAG: RluA family pseudouridine synthase [Gammaproteobacteria bacterium]|nr:RluA family pseudouridine synthase [Gammaproteobacteria bacterium]
MPIINLSIPEAHHHQRIDNFLVSYFKGVPKNHFYKIIRTGELRVNKGRVSPYYHLVTGDILRIPPLRTASSHTDHHVPKIKLSLLFEDNYLMAVNKPNDLAVHGGSGVSFGVIELLRSQYPNSDLSLVHRIDKSTSGLLLVAKKRSALRALQEQLRKRTMGKHYLAIVSGLWPQDLRHLELSLKKTRVVGPTKENQMVVQVVPPGQGVLTLTEVIQVQYLMDFSLLELKIHTGHTHQIRVHLAHYGFPIIGDEKYGSFALNKRLASQGHSALLLHAWKLSLSHPLDQKNVQLTAPIHPAFRSFLKTYPPNTPDIANELRADYL